MQSVINEIYGAFLFNIFIAIFLRKREIDIAISEIKNNIFGYRTCQYLINTIKNTVYGK